MSGSSRFLTFAYLSASFIFSFFNRLIDRGPRIVNSSGGTVSSIFQGSRATRVRQVPGPLDTSRQPCSTETDHISGKVEPLSGALSGHYQKASTCQGEDYVLVQQFCSVDCGSAYFAYVGGEDPNIGYSQTFFCECYTDTLCNHSG
jgi:hypothetical protein